MKLFVSFLVGLAIVCGVLAFVYLVLLGLSFGNVVALTSHAFDFAKWAIIGGACYAVAMALRHRWVKGGSAPEEDLLMDSNVGERSARPLAKGTAKRAKSDSATS